MSVIICSVCRQPFDEWTTSAPYVVDGVTWTTTTCACGRGSLVMADKGALDIGIEP